MTIRLPMLLTGVFCLGIAVMGSAAARASAETPSRGAAEAIIDDVIEKLWVQADAHWHKGEYNHLINLNKIIVSGHPDNLDAYANMGWLLWSMDRDEEAVAIYKQGIRANPNTFYMYDELGYYYFLRKKDYKQAIVYYEQAVRFPDCPAPTVNMLAHAYEKTNQLDKSLKTWQRAAKIPGNAPAKSNLEHVKRLIQQRDR
jgi:tetratricopeptide (TPR) repeat protein